MVNEAFVAKRFFLKCRIVDQGWCVFKGLVIPTYPGFH